MATTKHIGIASITAEGGALAYCEIVHASELILGRNCHPEISLHTHSFSRFTEGNAREDGTWDRLMIDSSQKLCRAGAEFFICPANTNHVVFDRVRGAVAIPWLHIASFVAERAADLQCKRALLLGTKTLMRSSVYSPFFVAKGIELRIPESTEQEMINRIIYDELVRGVVLPSSKVIIETIIEKYVTHEHCDSVILGCTELPLLITELPDRKDVVMLDSTRLVAHGAIAFSVGVSLNELERLNAASL